MSEDQNCLRFSLEEDVHFQKGEEVCEVLSISLEPSVTCHEFDQYIILRGTLELVGEYVPCSTETEEPDFYAVQNCASVTPCEGSSNCRFFYAFPVDITIPAERVRSGEELNMGVQTLDCTIDEDGCLHICAELYINGVYEREVLLEESNELHVVAELEDTLEEEEAFLARNADYALPEAKQEVVSDLHTLESYQQPDYAGFQFGTEVETESVQARDANARHEQGSPQKIDSNPTQTTGGEAIPAPYTTFNKHTHEASLPSQLTNVDVSSTQPCETGETQFVELEDAATLSAYQQPGSQAFVEPEGWQHEQQGVQALHAQDQSGYASEGTHSSEWQTGLHGEYHPYQAPEYPSQLQADQQALHQNPASFVPPQYQPESQWRGEEQGEQSEWQSPHQQSYPSVPEQGQWQGVQQNKQGFQQSMYQAPLAPSYQQPNEWQSGTPYQQGGAQALDSAPYAPNVQPGPMPSPLQGTQGGWQQPYQPPQAQPPEWRFTQHQEQNEWSANTVQPPIYHGPATTPSETPHWQANPVQQNELSSWQGGSQTPPSYFEQQLIAPSQQQPVPEVQQWKNDLTAQQVAWQQAYRAYQEQQMQLQSQQFEQANPYASWSQEHYHAEQPPSSEAYEEHGEAVSAELEEAYTAYQADLATTPEDDHTVEEQSYQEEALESEYEAEDVGELAQEYSVRLEQDIDTELQQHNEAGEEIHFAFTPEEYDVEEEEEHHDVYAKVDETEELLYRELALEEETDTYDQVIFPFTVSHEESESEAEETFHVEAKLSAQPATQPTDPAQSALVFDELASANDASAKGPKVSTVSDIFSTRSEANTCLKVYIVQRGDSLENLAERYSISSQKIARYNRLQPNAQIVEGSILYIPN